MAARKVIYDNASRISSSLLTHRLIRETSQSAFEVVIIEGSSRLAKFRAEFADNVVPAKVV